MPKILTGGGALAAHNRAQRCVKNAVEALDFSGVQDEPRAKRKLKEARTNLQCALLNLNTLLGVRPLEGVVGVRTDTAASVTPTEKE